MFDLFWFIKAFRKYH